MHPFKTERIQSFDNGQTHLTKVYRPETYESLKNIVLCESGVVARGAGLSYTLASVGTTATIDMSKFNRILEFNKLENWIKVESGITLGDLSSFLASKGFYCRVLPGYPGITIGGCIAFDVHGKSQSKLGNFSTIVSEIDLLVGNGERLIVNKEKESLIFEKTLGGCGTTGVILSAKILIEPLRGDKIEIRKVFTSSLLETIRVMKSEKGNYENVYSWNDLNSNSGFGRGIVFLENFKNTGSAIPKIHYRFKSIKKRLFFSIYIPVVIKFMNIIYFYINQVNKVEIKDLESALFPIYGKEFYYKFFGKKGFHEYQTIIPEHEFESYSRSLKSLLRENRILTTLGSLKIFHGEQSAYRFNGKGVCIAIDLPRNNSSGKFLEKLDSLTLNHKGIVNLSKDSRLSRDFINKVFPYNDAFNNSKFSSVMSSKLEANE